MCQVIACCPPEPGWKEGRPAPLDLELHVMLEGATQRLSHVSWKNSQCICKDTHCWGQAISRQRWWKSVTSAGYNNSHFGATALAGARSIALDCQPLQHISVHDWLNTIVATWKNPKFDAYSLLHVNSASCKAWAWTVNLHLCFNTKWGEEGNHKGARLDHQRLCNYLPHWSIFHQKWNKGHSKELSEKEKMESDNPRGMCPPPDPPT